MAVQPDRSQPICCDQILLHQAFPGLYFFAWLLDLINRYSGMLLERDQ